MTRDNRRTRRRLRDILRVDAARVDLADLDPADTPLAPGGKSTTKDAMVAHGAKLATLQEALYAEGVSGGTRRVLVVLQGMDTAGKGGVIKHVIGMVNPQGVEVAEFRKPTEEERRHDFLWRVRSRLPGPGMLGIFDRSHYEDVLVVRVHELVPPQVLEQRYDLINSFEHELVDSGVSVLKCFLHVSYDEQRKRLLARLEDPTKHWKVNPADLDERALWPKHQEAYRVALERCSTDTAPWYVVPSDHKWYRNWAVSQLLLEELTQLAPTFPARELDVAALKARLVPPG